MTDTVFELPNGMEMKLDGVEYRFHVRQRDNRIAIVITQPGWAAATKNDYWYVSIEDLKSTGVVDEGQDVKRWQYRKSHPAGVTYSEAIRIAKELYVNEAEAKIK